MFKIDPTANRINPLEVKRFTDLGFTERKHLQGMAGELPAGAGRGRWRRIADHPEGVR